MPERQERDEFVARPGEEREMLHDVSLEEYPLQGEHHAHALLPRHLFNSRTPTRVFEIRTADLPFALSTTDKSKIHPERHGVPYLYKTSSSQSFFFACLLFQASSVLTTESGRSGV